MNNRTALWAVKLVLLASALSGCAFLTSNPGHPDSYATSYLTKLKHWPPLTATASGRQNPTGQPTNTVFAVATTPQHIYSARRYAHEYYLNYEAAAYKAQDLENELAIPLFGAAIGVAATALSHTSTVAVAATGLGGAAAGAGFEYLHPDKDAVTDQTAEAALICVVDRSNVLTVMSAIPLTLDRAALQDALTKLEVSSGPLSNSTDPNDDKAKAAVQAVLSSADSTMQSLNAAISQYVQLPGEIYETADTINEAAKANGARALSYTSILQTLQTSAANQSNVTQAASSVQTASTAASTVAATTPATPAQQALLSPATAPNTNLNAASQVVAGVATAAPGVSSDPAARGGGDAGSGGTPPSTAEAPVTDDGTAQSKSLGDVLNAGTTVSAMTLVTEISKIALNDIPNPNFSDIAANIKACALGK